MPEESAPHEKPQWSEPEQKVSKVKVTKVKSKDGEKIAIHTLKISIYQKPPEMLIKNYIERSQTREEIEENLTDRKSVV